MKKDWTISFVRMVAMMLIVTCHILQYYGNALAWWLNVGVQVFFAMSGFLFGARTIEDPIRFVIRRFVKILVPCYFLVVCVLIGYGVICGECFSIKEIVSVVCFRDIAVQGLRHLWFIAYICFCYLLIPFLDAAKKSLVKYDCHTFIFVLLTMGGLYAIWGCLLHTFFLPAWILCFACGYYVAYARCLYGEEVFRKMAMALVALGGVAFVLRISLTVPSLVLPYLRATMGIGLFFAAVCFLRMKRTIFLEVSDHYSYEVYLVHHIFNWVAD